MSDAFWAIIQVAWQAASLQHPSAASSRLALRSVLPFSYLLQLTLGTPSCWAEQTCLLKQGLQEEGL